MDKERERARDRGRKREGGRERQTERGREREARGARALNFKIVPPDWPQQQSEAAPPIPESKVPRPRPTCSYERGSIQRGHVHENSAGEPVQPTRTRQVHLHRQAARLAGPWPCTASTTSVCRLRPGCLAEVEIWGFLGPWGLDGTQAFVCLVPFQHPSVPRPWFAFCLLLPPMSFIFDKQVLRKLRPQHVLTSSRKAEKACSPELHQYVQASVQVGM